VADKEIEIGQRRRSGIYVAKGSLPEECPPHRNVDRVRSGYGYKCRDCKEGVMLVTVGVVYMTGAEALAFKKGELKIVAQPE